MKSLRTIMLLLVFVASPAVFGLLCGCEKTSQDKSDKEANSPLYIHESEQISVNLDDASNKATLAQRIGVGIDDKRGKNYTFSVVLKDQIPSSLQVLSPKEGVAKIRTIYKKSIPQKFSIERMENFFSLCFDLKDVPAVDLSAEGGCCACDFSCGGACSVELTYKATGNIEQQWATVSLKSEPKALAVGERNSVTITVTIENHFLQRPVLVMRIPRRVKGTQIDIAAFPEGFVKKEASRWIILEKTITDSRSESKERKSEGMVNRPVGSPAYTFGFSQEQMTVSLVIIPQEKGELMLPNLVEVRGSLEELVYPAVEVISEGKVERTNSSTVSYRGSAMFFVK